MTIGILKSVNHPLDYNGLPFLSIIHFNNNHNNQLVLVDNVIGGYVFCYNIGLLGQEGMKLEDLLPVIQEWYDRKKKTLPVCIEFMKLGLTKYTGKVYKSYPVTSIEYIQGPANKFCLNKISHKRKRRVIT